MPSDLLVSRLGRQTWAALRQSGHIVELELEFPGQPAGVGRVVLGRVGNVLPGLQAAFVEIGETRQGFLHARDLRLDGETEPRDQPIERLLEVGQSLIVQVQRGPLGEKGARISCVVQLAGRAVVYQPFSEAIGVSRRIEEPAEREHLEALLRSLDVRGGFVVRTNARGIDDAALIGEAEALVLRWNALERDATSRSAPALLSEEPSLLQRRLRALPAEVQRIAVDDDGLMRELRAWSAEIGFAGELVRHTGESVLAVEAGILREASRLSRPRVWLRCGGCLLIEPTEALVAVDVNTGRFTGKVNAEQTALTVNLEAVEELSRQLRLRDLGGTVVVDLIDMQEPAHRERVVDAARQHLSSDPARSRVLGIDELGLLKLTRKRHGEGIGNRLGASCGVCAGSGRVAGPLLLAARAMGQILEAPRRYRLTADPTTADAVRRALDESGPLSAEVVEVVEGPEGRAPGYALEPL